MPLNSTDRLSIAARAARREERPLPPDWRVPDWVGELGALVAAVEAQPDLPEEAPFEHVLRRGLTASMRCWRGAPSRSSTSGSTPAPSSSGCLPELDVRAHVDVGVRTTIAAGAEGVDCLCCGALGRVDVVASIAARLASSDLMDAARGMAAAALARRRELGAWRPVEVLPRGIFHASLFQGAAGAGDGVI